MKDEIFVPIKGFEGRFEISNYGTIVSINGRKSGRSVLKPHNETIGYNHVILRKAPLYKQSRVHVLVAEHFVQNTENKTWVNHKDGNKKNNYFSNLEWCTPAENVQHAVNAGLMDFKGSKHVNSKLTEAQVLEIRSLYPSKTHKEIGLMFNICRRQVGDIINRINWKHI